MDKGKILRLIGLLLVLTVLLVTGVIGFAPRADEGNSRGEGGLGNFESDIKENGAGISNNGNEIVDNGDETGNLDIKDSGEVLSPQFIEYEKDLEYKAMEIIKDMTLREKVGQLFIIRPESLCDELDGKYATSLTDQMRESYENYPAGGFALFGRNIVNEEQLISFNEDLNSLKYNPLLCIDEEGGEVSRLSNHPEINVDEIPNMQDIAATMDAYEAYKVGDNIGYYLNRFGFDVDFAPVADVNTNPDNPIIGVRAFGDDPVVAGAMVAAVIDGLHNNNIGSCIKHFPGHGDTQTDTHLGYAETLKTWEEMKNCEMIPFVAGMNSSTDMIMTAHIAAPNVTGSDEPASLSYTLLTQKLRGELRYDGIIITDALEMKAITSMYSSSEAAVKCILAGADIVLMPENYKEAFDGVVEAVENGTISEERLEESLKRVLKLKLRFKDL